MNHLFRTLLPTALAAAALLFVAAPGHAQISDGADDFLLSYTGPKNGDLDVLSANVIYDGSFFTLTSTQNGVIGTTAGALYVWGFDRGAGIARFSPALANTENILFDSVITLRPDTTASITRIGGTTTNLSAGAVTINGATMTARIAASELPSLGLDPTRYTWNLWPRVGTGNNNQISDFAPNTFNVRVTSTIPEPSTALLMAPFAAVPALLGSIRRRRKK